MNAREVARRVLLWSLVAVYLVATVIRISAVGTWWTLTGFGGFVLVGTLILTQRPRNGVGRILLITGLYWAFYGLLDIPGFGESLPPWVELLASWSGYMLWLILPLLVLVYPSGRVSSRLGRVVFGVLAALGVVLTAFVLVDPSPLWPSGRENPFGWDAAGPVVTPLLSDGGIFVVTGFIVVALVDLVLRWRRADGVERLQFRWLAFGTAIMAAMIVVVSLNPDLPVWFASSVAALCFNAIPIAIWVAITRHGLYEIGRVVSRTVSYVLVTAVAVGVYALVVTSASLLLPDQSTAAVAIATLIAAAIFLPVLRWFQRIVDRRFDRERYDAEEVVRQFGEQLRTGSDPAATTPDLIRAAERALQPASVAFWTSGRMR